MKTITRMQVAKLDKSYSDMLKKEKHHNHEIIQDEHGSFRWKENPSVNKILERISLNDLCPLLYHLGYDKNSEVYRKLYRDIGYSLSGYWEIFYWEGNNDEANEYVPNASCVGKNNKRA